MIDDQSTRVVDVTRSPAGVCRITLNRPDRLNSLTDEMREILTAELIDLGDDASISVVVLRGAGRAFCTGADLEQGFGGTHTWAERRLAAGRWQRLIDLIERLPQVTVAEVRRFAIGGGALLAAACDLRIGSDDLTVALPELSVGMPLAWGGIPRLAREIGLPIARDLVMTGRTMHADEAHRTGFVQRLVADSDLADETERVVASLLRVPRGTLGITRAAFAAVTRHHTGVDLAWADADVVGWAVAEPDVTEAIESFRSQRRR